LINRLHTLFSNRRIQHKNDIFKRPLDRRRDRGRAAAHPAFLAGDGVTSFVNSFKENPGRRLISIYFGMLLGLALAWLIGLDLFQATGGLSETASLTLTSHMGVACTGLILGLGASPTHEVISILKEVKLRRRDENK
jgi:hypothetical protein